MSAGVAILAAGGTAGHVNPAAALAAALAARGWSAALLLDRRGLRYAPKDVETVEIDAFSPSGSAGALKAFWALGQGFWSAFREIGARRPAVAIGFGSYAAAPTMAAAFCRRVPVVAHEQNAVLGRANRFSCRFASALAASFEETAGRPERIRARTVVTGNPVRPEFAATPLPAVPTSSDKLRLLIVGGSQGARILSDVLPPAIALLSPERQARLRIEQQCRPEDLERVRTAYGASAAEVELATYFDDIAERMKRAHLMISRSGASSVAEICAVGRPSMLLPLPHALDDDQGKNARRLERAGAAIVAPDADFAPDAVRDRIAAFLDAPERLVDMARAARGFARPDAAERLADLAIAVATSRLEFFE